MHVKDALWRNTTIRRYARRTAFWISPRAKRWYENLEHLYADGRWADVVRHVSEAVDGGTWFIAPIAYIRLAQAHARMGESERATAVLASGAAAFPSSDQMLRARAELAMVDGLHEDAISMWQRYAEVRDGEPPESVRPFPLRGTDFEWFDTEWQAVLAAWPWGGGERRVSAHMFWCTLDTLLSAGFPREAERIARDAILCWPDDALLVAKAAEVLIRVAHPADRDSAIAELEASGRSPHIAPIIRGIRGAEAVIESLATVGRAESALEEAGEPAGELRVISVSAHSPTAMLILAKNFWDDARVHEEALRLARADGWPEGPSPTDRVSKVAWLEARRFARGRGLDLGISDDALARAVFHNVKHEVILKLPVERIAAAIARHHDGGPIFIEMMSVTTSYLVSYPASRFASIYLYDELNRLGLPVYLVRFYGNRATGWVDGSLALDTSRPVNLRFTPSIGGLRPTRRDLTDGPAAPKSLVVPAGIRSLDRVLERVEEPLILNSGSALKGFAYDRSIRQVWAYPVHATVHPRLRLLPKFVFQTSLADAWHVDGDELVPCTGADGNTDATMMLSCAPWPRASWHELLASAITPYFKSLARNAAALLEKHNISEIHLADYLYAESAIVADVARQRGAQIHVWPHSTNPVHVQFQDMSLVADVRAVTRSGAEQWRGAYPNVKVIHDPGLMLQRAHVSVPWTAGAPVSLVLMGGRPMMRHLPLLDVMQHEDLYRRLFAELQPLVDEGRLTVYFKPRGRSGENESWLEGVVGRALDWQPVLQHPMRIDLPNPVFASVSVASSALLEGISRGIPGMIIREGVVRDYLVADSRFIFVGNAREATAHLESHVEQELWDEWRRSQSQALEHEFVPETDHADSTASAHT